MIRQTLRPIARTRLPLAARSAPIPRPGHSTRFASAHSGSNNSTWNWTIIASGSAALAFVGYIYMAVPLKHDLEDHARRQAERAGRPEMLKALTVERDVSKSVLDQDSLKVPIHSKAVRENATGSKTAAASPTESSKKDAVPELVEKKAEEAQQPAQSAYNEETGEINWDCPCLGGMADGPCGEQFKAAFSCFVYSDKEPKGVECVEKFKGMQDCFREHPEIYGEEIDDDEDESTNSSAASSESHPPPPGSIRVSAEDVEKASQDASHPATPGKDPRGDPKIMGVTPESTMTKGVNKYQKNYNRPGGKNAPVGEGSAPAPMTGEDYGR